MSATYGAIVANATLTVNVVGPGVGGYISPPSGSPPSNFILNLTNYGTATDSYNLSILGALGEAASIQPTVGPIASGQSAQVPITLNTVSFVPQGNYTLRAGGLAG